MRGSGRSWIGVLCAAWYAGGESVSPEESFGLREKYATALEEEKTYYDVTKGAEKDKDDEVFKWALQQLNTEARRWQNGAAPWSGPWKESKSSSLAEGEEVGTVSYVPGDQEERRLDKRGTVLLRDDDEIMMACYDEIYKYGLCLWNAGLGYAPSYSYSYNDWDDDDSVEACAFIMESPEFSCSMFGNPNWGDDEDDTPNNKKKKKKKKKNDDAPKEDDLLEPISFCAPTFFAAFDCQYTARCGVQIKCSSVSAAAPRSGPSGLAVAAAVGAAGAVALTA